LCHDVRDVRRDVSWLLTTPLLIAGVLAGHSLGYRWAVADPDARAHMLEESGHAYFSYLPLVLAVGLTLAAAALAGRVRSAARGERIGTSPPWLVALLPPVAFIGQELIERLLHTGHVHGSVLLEPAVLIGLALQVPIALLALGLAWLLSEGADAVGRALGNHPPAQVAQILLGTPADPALVPARSVAARGWSERGPPSHSS
jgi:hypothetical protein